MQKEEVPQNGAKPFGAFFPYGGLVKFDSPIQNTSVFSMKIPEKCKTVYLTTQPFSRFLISNSLTANVSLERNLQVCFLSVGNPSRVDIKMHSEKYGKIKILKIDDNEMHAMTYKEDAEETLYFDSSILIYWHNSYSYPDDFANISVLQRSNTIPLDSHVSKFNVLSEKHQFISLITDKGIKRNVEHFNAIHYETNENHDLINNQYNNTDNNNSQDDFLTSGLIALIVISVFAISCAIFCGCCGLCCCLWYKATIDKTSEEDKTKTSNQNNNDQNQNQNGFQIDETYNNYIPPTIPQNAPPSVVYYPAQEHVQIPVYIQQPSPQPIVYPNVVQYPQIIPAQPQLQVPLLNRQNNS